MAQINPYLGFNGNCEEAFNFYKSVFGGELQNLSRFSDMPPIPGMEIPESDRNRIMHVRLPIGNGSILMGSDGNPALGEIPLGKSVSLAVGTDTNEDADRIFAGLSEGGKVTMPISTMFWGGYFGMVTDKFGFEWMVSCEPKH